MPEHTPPIPAHCLRGHLLPAGGHDKACPECSDVVQRARHLIGAGIGCIDCLGTSDAEDTAQVMRELADTIDRVRAALAQHPACDLHPDDDVVTCGWKRAVADITAAIGETP